MDVLFQVGKVRVSRDVLMNPSITVPDLVAAFERYLKGDWGIAADKESLHNDLALTSGDPIVATYKSAVGTKFRMSTNSGETTVFLACSDCNAAPNTEPPQYWGQGR